MPARLISFLKCDRGVTVIIFALLLIPMLLLSGMAIDYLKASEVKVEFQDRLDAAVLAGSAMKDVEDPAERVKIAEEHFRASLTPGLAGLGQQVKFELVNDETGLRGTLATQVPTRMMSMFGWTHANVYLTSVTTFEQPNRQLDMVFCIDASGSMQETIDAVRDNASSLEQHMNDELEKRNLPTFAAIRTRVIFFRDFGPDQGDPDTYQPGAWNEQTLTSDQPAMRESKKGQFYTLPNERETMRKFLDDETAWGGGDEPESGFICLNEAMHSNWAQRNDPLDKNLTQKASSNLSKKISSIVPMIVIWTDANALPLDDLWSQRNKFYPNNAPRDLNDLRAAWGSKRIDQKNKLLVFFGDTNNASEMKPPRPLADMVPRWKEIENWDGYYWGGPLKDANREFVTKLVDALAVSPAMPRLTQ